MKNKKAMFLFLLIIFMSLVIFFISGKKEQDSLVKIQQPKVDLVKDSINKDSHIKSNKIASSQNEDLEESKNLEINDEESNQDNSEYVFDCTNQLDRLIEKYKSKYEKESLIELFKNTNTESAQLAYFLMSKGKKDFDESIKYILKDMEENYQNNKLKGFIYAGFCLSNLEYCDAKIVDDIYQYYDNGLLWLATLNKNDGREKTLNTLRQITSASEISLYYSDFIGLHMQAYKDININSLPVITIASIGHAATFKTPGLDKFIALINFCEEQSEIDLSIAQACLNAGDSITKKGKTLIVKSLGLSLQIKTLSKLDMKKVLDQKKIEKKKLQFKNNEKASAMILFDKGIIELWLQNLKINGEKIAYEASVQEAIHLSKDPNYNPCPDEVLTIN